MLLRVFKSHRLLQSKIGQRAFAQIYNTPFHIQYRKTFKYSFKSYNIT